MKKFFAALIALMIFSAQVEAISCEDATFAVDTINKELRKWNCTPLRIQYAGDELNNAENISYMNELAESHGFEKKFSACMIFYTDFISPPDDGKISAWNYDSEYKNYLWYFGLYEDGKWYLMSNGY